jgi:hypothetical protein
LAFLFEKDAHAEQGRRVREQAEASTKISDPRSVL